MNIWLDTTNARLIQKAIRLGILSGVTTNPSIIENSQGSIDTVLKNLLHYQEGPVAVQVTSTEVKKIVQEGQKLFLISNRLIIKVPVTEEGLEAIHLLSRQGIPTMGTAVYDLRQGFMAALAGAHYVAPFIGRIENNGKNPWEILRSLIHLLNSYKLKTKVLAASIPTVDHVIECAKLGVYGVTVKDSVFEQLISSPASTIESTDEFAFCANQIKSTLASSVK